MRYLETRIAYADGTTVDIERTRYEYVEQAMPCRFGCSTRICPRVKTRVRQTNGGSWVEYPEGMGDPPGCGSQPPDEDEMKPSTVIAASTLALFACDIGDTSLFSGGSGGQSASDAGRGGAPVDGGLPDAGDASPDVADAPEGGMGAQSSAGVSNASSSAAMASSSAAAGGQTCMPNPKPLTSCNNSGDGIEWVCTKGDSPPAVPMCRLILTFKLHDYYCCYF